MSEKSEFDKVTVSGLDGFTCGNEYSVLTSIPINTLIEWANSGWGGVDGGCRLTVSTRDDNGVLAYLSVPEFAKPVLSDKQLDEVKRNVKDESWLLVTAI